MSADLSDLPLFSRADALAAGQTRYAPAAVCPHCGESEYRVIRYDCQGCRRLKSPIRGVLRAAAWRVIVSRPLTGQMRYMIGADDREFRAWLAGECERRGFALSGYGVTWQLYHKRELHTFDLRSNRDRARVNRLENLEVRRAHNAPRKEGRR